MMVYPSLMGADQLNLKEVISTLEPYCTGFHLDIMDGHLVPNIVGGPTWVNTISAITKKKIWVHLMVTDPAYWIPLLKLPPASMIDFQYETPIDHQSIVHIIHKNSHKAGISIGPETPIDTVIPLFSLCDYVSIMGVKPGFSGQTFIPNTITKIKKIQEYRKKQALSFFIACDGGITASITPQLHQAGVTHIAIASTLFTAPDQISLLQTLSTQ
jgi:ribulose-phosphate 3-epimerase